MLGNIIGVLIAIVALLGAGLVSYTYLEERFGSAAPTEVVSKVATKTPVVQPKTSGGSTQGVVNLPTIQKKSVPVKSSTPAPIAVTPQKVVVPGPLRIEPVSTPLPSVVLTAQGVFEYTNRARAENGGLGALTHNETLDRIAMTKLLDMFSKQYFEHISPTGVGPSDLAKAAGYAYVIVGENLALGNFANDTKLVDAWMASPGHRANILNPRYQEIGIAAGRGMYEGRETWLAVQSFGMPLSSCPAIDAQKKIQIETNNATIATMRIDLDVKKAQIDATPSNNPKYNVYVGEFNAMVVPYNALIESSRILVEQYNSEVKAFNNCAAGTTTN